MSNHKSQITDHRSPPAGPAVLLYRGSGIVGSLIQWQTRGPYSHAALLHPAGIVYESREGAGVQRVRVDDWSGIDVYDVAGMYSDRWERAFAFVEARLGLPYDWRAVLRFVTRRPASENGKWFCSELVDAAIAAAGVDLLARVPAHHVDPSMLRLSPRLHLRKPHPLPVA